MPTFRLTVTATAEIEEIWEVEAESEDAARAVVDNLQLHEHKFISDRTLGEERDRELDKIEVVHPPVIVIGPDDFAACPECGVRLDPDFDDETHDNRVVDEDEDGPIYLGTCMDHGAFRFQIEED